MDSHKRLSVSVKEGKGEVYGAVADLSPHPCLQDAGLCFLPFCIMARWASKSACCSGLASQFLLQQPPSSIHFYNWSL